MPITDRTCLEVGKYKMCILIIIDLSNVAFSAKFKLIIMGKVKKKKLRHSSNSQTKCFFISQHYR